MASITQPQVTAGCLAVRGRYPTRTPPLSPGFPTTSARPQGGLPALMSVRTTHGPKWTPSLALLDAGNCQSGSQSKDWWERRVWQRTLEIFAEHPQRLIFSQSHLVSTSSFFPLGLPLLPGACWQDGRVNRFTNACFCPSAPCRQEKTEGRQPPWPRSRQHEASTCFPLTTTQPLLGGLRYCLSLQELSPSSIPVSVSLRVCRKANTVLVIPESSLPRQVPGWPNQVRLLPLIQFILFPPRKLTYKHSQSPQPQTKPLTSSPSSTNELPQKFLSQWKHSFPPE